MRKACPDSDMEEAVEAVFAHPRFKPFIKEARMLVRTKIMRERELTIIAQVVAVWQLLRWLLTRASSRQLSGVAAVASEVLTATLMADCAKDAWQAAGAVDICKGEAVLDLCTTRVLVDLVVKTLDAMLVDDTMPGWFLWQKQLWPTD